MPFEGCYLQWHELGLPDHTLPPHPHLHDGTLAKNGNHGMNGVTWWILQHHGITVFGPPLDPHVFSVDWSDLCTKMHNNLNTYWVSFTIHPRRIAWLLTDYGVQWAVLGVLRQFYSFHEHAIVSKVDAGVYALDRLPARYHRIVHEAIDIRQGKPASHYHFRLARAVEAYAVLRLIIAACNNKFNNMVGPSIGAG